MHAEFAALVIIGYSLNHGAENIRIDLFPIQTAGMQQISPRHFGKAWHIGVARKQATVDVRKYSAQDLILAACAIRNLGVHGAEQFGNHLMGVGSICSLIRVTVAVNSR